eukprot:s4551_g2.t1
MNYGFEVAASMNDSSKRLRDDPPVGYPSAMSQPVPSYVATSEGSMLPSPMPMTATQQIDLPEKVASVADWGKTVVTFGKLKKLKTYVQILQDENEDMISYKKHLFSHFSQGSPQLRDLVSYSKKCGCDPMGSQAPVIPGTTIVTDPDLWSYAWELTEKTAALPVARMLKLQPREIGTWSTLGSG